MIVSRKAQRLILYGGIVIFALLHLYYLNAPPNGYHAWRESDTAAVTLNYYQEDYDFFHPRINQRGAEDGITGMELPIYNFVAASLYKLIGPYHAVARGLTVLIAVFTLALVYRMTCLLADPLVATFAVWATAFSPLFLFYSFKIMPDVTMLMFLVAGFYLFLRFMNSERFIYLCGSALCLILSGTIKPLGLSLFLPMAGLFWSKWRFDLRKLLLYGAYVATVFLSVLAWFLYARSVNLEHHSVGFYLGENLLDFPRYLFNDMFIRKLVFQWPAELWIGWALVPAFVWGMVVVWKSRLRRLMSWWLLSAYIVFAVMAPHSSSHDYYTLIIVPVLAVVSGFGLVHLLRSGGWRRWVAVTLLTLAPVTAFQRIAHRLGDTSEFYLIRQAAEEQIPKDALVIVEDNTSAVRLYQMNRHGWPLQDGVTAERVLTRQKQGAKYLVLARPAEEYPDLLAGIESVSKFRVGPLYGYRLGEKR